MPEYPTTVTHLEMTAPFAAHEAVAWPDDVQFALQESITLEEYRRLYDEIGRPWRWVNRRTMSDTRLAGIIHHPATEIFLLRRGNQTIGFVELNFRLFPCVEFVFVGLREAEIGKGLGGRMLTAALAHAQARAPDRIIIQTCTLDHPNALVLYQKVGFTVSNRKEIVIHDD